MELSETNEISFKNNEHHSFISMPEWLWYVANCHKCLWYDETIMKGDRQTRHVTTSLSLRRRNRFRKICLC